MGRATSWVKKVPCAPDRLQQSLQVSLRFCSWLTLSANLMEREVQATQPDCGPPCAPTGTTPPPSRVFKPTEPPPSTFQKVPNFPEVPAMDTGALDPKFFTRKEHRKVQPVLPHCCGDVPVPIAKTCGRHLTWREGVCSGDYVRDPEMGRLRCVIWGEDLACVSPSFSHPHSSSLPGMSLSRGWGG